MSDLIITPGSGKIDFIYQSGQEVSRLESIIIDPIDGLVFSGKISASSVTSPINVTATSSNVNYPFIFASSGETGAKNLLIDSAGGTYNPSTNTATIDVSGNLTGTATTASYANALNPANSYTVVGITGALTGTSSWASNATNALQLGGTVASSYVTLTGTQTLTGKTITGTFTGSLFGTSSWATNATTATTVTTNANLTGEVTSIGNATTISSSAITTAKIADAAVTNAKLASSSVTIGSTAVSLGAAATVTIAGLNSVTSTTFVGSLTGTATTASYANALNAANQYTVGGITGSLFGTSSWATNATNALTATNATQLNGQAASYYTNIPARLGYTPVNQAGDTVTGNLIINGNFSVNGSFTAFSASNVYISSSQLYIEDNILTLNAFSPYLRYAGIEMYDSGSGTLSNLLWDGEGDYFFLSGSSVNGKIITGPDSQANLTANFVPKATAGYKLGNSLIYDNGTNVGIGTTTPNSTLQIAGTSTGILTVGTLTNDWGGVVAIGTTNGNGIILSKVNTANDSNRVLVLMRDDTNGASIIGYAPAGTYDSVGFQIRASASSYFNGGNVGIGTTVPVAKLHVNSTTAGVTLLRADGTSGTLFSVVDDLSDSLMSVNNSAGLPVLEVFADDRIVAGQYGQNDFVVVNNKVGIGTNNPLAKLHVTGSSSVPAAVLMGNVGIGTTSPAYLLDVSGSSRFGFTSTNTHQFTGSVSVVGSVTAASFTGSLSGSITSALTASYLTPTNSYTITNLTASNISASATGSFGIVGIGTSSPVAALDVSRLEYPSLGGVLANFSAGTTDPTTEKYVILRQTYTGTAFDSPMLVFRANANSANSGSFGIVRTTSNGSIVFSNVDATSGTVTAVSEKMRIAADGNVGIGTTSPAYLLHVNSTGFENVAKFRGVNDTTIIIGGSDAGGSGEQYITYQNTTTAASAWMVGMDDGEDFRFAYGVAGEIDDSKTKVKIGQDGNVGIGTTTPAAKLEISGSSNSALLNIKSPISGAILFVSGSGAVGIGTSAVGAFTLQVSGSFGATTKSFIIEHPTKAGKKLMYGSLESPYHGIRLTGRDTLKEGKCKIQLPDYIYKLILHDSVNIQLTGIKCNKTLYIDDINVPENYFTIAYDKTVFESYKTYDFFWDFTAIRADVPELQTEM